MAEGVQISKDSLTAAIADGELAFYYQPKVSLVTGRMCGGEALLRWIRRDGGMVMPNDFIPMAEEIGFITTISRAMFPKLVEDMFIINGVNEHLVTSFNLSARDFADHTMVGMIEEAIRFEHLDAANLQVELTEASVINEDNPVLRNSLQALTGMGVSLAMDDYGTGYSSIDSLSKWPFSTVKIDQGLIRRMAESERSTTIVQASIRMAHQLKMGIVAEGIETAESYDFLLHAGCTEAQGFWIARPMPLDEYLAFIRRDQRWHGLPTGLIHMAILDHVQWRQALIAQVTQIAFNGSRDANICSTKAELDPSMCKLGQWYDGPGREFGDNALYKALDEPHRKLHRLGAELLEAAKARTPRTDLVERMRHLTRQSAILLELLQELENEALLETGILPEQGVL